jgi:hypothetical protein
MAFWRRLAMFASAGTVLLCLGLLAAPFLYNAGRLALARHRWEQRGGSAYTVVIKQLCNCAEGEYRLTVRGGRVVAVETVGAVGRLTSQGPNPAGFNDLTVEASFERVGRSLRAHWWPSLRRQSRVEYDAALGYVTRYEILDPAAPDHFYVYIASDLGLDSP